MLRGQALCYALINAFADSLPAASHLMMTDADRPTVLSSFSGAGGLDLGLEAAGFDVIGCVEEASIARETLKSNRPEWKQLEPHDITAFAEKLTLEKMGMKQGQLDLIAGGPPCQTFSKAAQWSKSGRKGLKSECGSAIHAFLAIIERLRPRAVLIENVPGFVRGKTNAIPYLRTFFDEINREDETISYRLQHRIVNAADYGAPQRRKRAIVVALRDGSELEWPSETHSDAHLTAWDALADVTPEEPPTPRGKWADLLPSIPEGKNYQWHTDRGGGRELFGYRTRFWSFLLKLAKDQPSWTLPAQPGPATGPFHWDNRPLSIQEMLRLQTFPASWIVEGDRREQVRQVGNATPPLLAEIMGRQLLRQLYDHDFQDPPTHSIQRQECSGAPGDPAPVPAKYLKREGDHDPHPGPGKGPSPVSEAATNV